LVLFGCLFIYSKRGRFHRYKRFDVGRVGFTDVQTLKGFDGNRILIKKIKKIKCDRKKNL